MPRIRTRSLADSSKETSRWRSGSSRSPEKLLSIPLTPHDPGQAAEVGKDVGCLRSLPVLAGHVYGVHAGLRSPADVGDGVVADHDGPVGGDAGEPERLVEDLAPRLLDAEHRGGNDAVEVAYPAEAPEDLL